MRRKPGRPPGTRVQYREIAEDLALRIRCFEWPIGTKIPSSRMLARHYGVGQLTIRKAVTLLKHEGLIQVEPRSTPKAGIGASLESIFRPSVAIVISTDLYSIQKGKGSSHAIWEGLLRANLGSSYTFLVLQDLRWRKEFPAGLQRLPLQGVLLLGLFSHPLLKQYETLKQPVVLMDHPPTELKIHSISVASFDCANSATRRLLELGHRRLAFVRPFVGTKSVPGVDQDAEDRTRGFLDACAEAGLKRSEYKVFTAGFYAPSPTLAELLGTQPAFSAVITTNPGHALDIEQQALKFGLRVPKDLSVLSFNEVTTPGRAWSGPLMDFKEMGLLAMQMIQDQYKGPKDIKLPFSIREGETLARPKPRPGRSKSLKAQK